MTLSLMAKVSHLNPAEEVGVREGKAVSHDAGSPRPLRHTHAVDMCESLYILTLVVA